MTSHVYASCCGVGGSGGGCGRRISKSRVTYAEISPKMGNPTDLAGTAEEEDWYDTTRDRDSRSAVVKAGGLSLDCDHRGGQRERGMITQEPRCGVHTYLLMSNAPGGA